MIPFFRASLPHALMITGFVFVMLLVDHLQLGGWMQTNQLLMLLAKT